MKKYMFLWKTAFHTLFSFHTMPEYAALMFHAELFSFHTIIFISTATISISTYVSTRHWCASPLQPPRPPFPLPHRERSSRRDVRTECKRRSLKRFLGRRLCGGGIGPLFLARLLWFYDRFALVLKKRIFPAKSQIKS